MGRKRKKRAARSFNALPLFIGLALAAIVIWAVLPRQHAVRTNHRHKAIAIETASPALPSQSPQAGSEAQPQVSPEAQPSPSTPSTEQTPLGASPAASPRSSPQASSGPAEVAIIIDDCGQWPKTERGYLDLPIALTLSVLPHVPYSHAIAQEAQDAGKGIMLHLPMQPLSGAVSGPGEIRTAMSDTAIAAQTENDIAQVPLAAGVNNHEGSAASADPRVMKDVIEVVKAHNLFFIDSRTNAKSVGALQAQEDHVPNASRDVFLDNRADVAYSEAMLARTARIAMQTGSAIAIGHPKATTLEALRRMYPQMEAEGVRFVLASNLVH